MTASPRRRNVPAPGYVTETHANPAIRPQCKLPVPDLLFPATEGRGKSDAPGRYTGGMGALEDSPLGKATHYHDRYDPALLLPLPRAGQRAQIGVTAPLPF